MQMFNADELAANQNDNALDSQTGSADGTEDGDETSSSSHEEGGAERARRQIDRLKEENRRLKEQIGSSTGEKGFETPVTADSELLYRAYLTQKGIDQEEVQDKAIERSKRLGVSIDKLLRDEDERQLLELHAKRISSSHASARPTGRGGATKKDAQWYVDNGQMPDDPKMVTQVWKLLAEKER